MTDAEIVCAFMADPTKAGVWGEWWSASSGDDGALFKSPKPLTLDALHKVEARLTDEQWERYCATFAVNNLPEPTVNPGYMETVAWDKAHLHATAEQKLAALANVLDRSHR